MNRKPVAVALGLLALVVACGLFAMLSDVAETSSMSSVAIRRLKDTSVQMQTEVSPTAFLPHFIVSCLFAFYYKGKVIDNLPQLTMKSSKKTFSNGLFGCFGDTTQCLYHWCCPFVSAAKNMHVTGVMDYWPGFCMMWCTMTLGTAFCCIGPIARAYFFGQVKKSIGIQDSFVTDCCLQMWCFPCSIGQESMEVDSLLGVEIACVSVEAHGSDSGSGSGSEA